MYRLQYYAIYKAERLEFLSLLRSKDERTGRMTKLIDAELIIEELEKIIQLVKDADGVKAVPLVENALNITSEYLRTGRGRE